MSEILAFVDTEFTREQAAKMARDHFEQDLLKQNDSRFCSIGCMTEGTYNHETLVKQFGFMQPFSYIIDELFESHGSGKEAGEFHVWVYENIPIGLNTSRFWMEYLIEVLTDEHFGIKGMSSEGEKLLDEAVKLYRDLLDNGISEAFGGLAEKADGVYHDSFDKEVWFPSARVSEFCYIISENEPSQLSRILEALRSEKSAENFHISLFKQMIEEAQQNQNENR